MITEQEYFGTYAKHPGITESHRVEAKLLLERVSALLNYARLQGVITITNPRTRSQVSGTKNGGWRPKDCPEGASNSSHKQGKGVDVYDPGNHLDKWLTDEVLEDFGLYREHPSATNSWCHLTTRPPASGKRTFYP